MLINWIKNNAVKTEQELNSILKKYGVEIKDGLAIISQTNERFSGSITRHAGFLGLQKEIINFSDGDLTKKLYYILNQEKLGYFYKEGKTYLEIEKNKDNCFLKIYTPECSLSRHEICQAKQKVFDKYKTLIKNNEI